VIVTPLVAETAWKGKAE